MYNMFDDPHSSAGKIMDVFEFIRNNRRTRAERHPILDIVKSQPHLWVKDEDPNVVGKHFKSINPRIKRSKG